MAAEICYKGAMKRDQALAALRRVEPALRELGVSEAALFGSTARGDGGVASDIDIAVKPAAGRPFEPLTLLSIHGVLGDAFGHGTPIDVVVLPARNASLGAAIERDRVLAFA
jgi:hypothetical protein